MSMCTDVGSALTGVGWSPPGALSAQARREVSRPAARTGHVVPEDVLQHGVELRAQFPILGRPHQVHKLPEG
jgi:hypothetical protein